VCISDHRQLTPHHFSVAGPGRCLQSFLFESAAEIASPFVLSRTVGSAEEFPATTVVAIAAASASGTEVFARACKYDLGRFQ
jgi:hypothetical protein